MQFKNGVRICQNILILTNSWLQSELKKRNLTQNDVVYAVLAANGNVYIDTYSDHIHSPIDKE